MRSSAPAPPPVRKEAVLCIGCVEDTAFLDAVLAAGSYQLCFLQSSEGAYTEILNTKPDRVILCMRADDEVSLQLLSMLNLDPRTNRIPVLTCVPAVATGPCALEAGSRNGPAQPRPDVLLH